MDYLPIFVDLRGSLVVVVGGGAVAARKVSLLLSAHARVRVVAPALVPALAQLRDAGRIEHVAAVFSPPRLHEARLVVAATADDTVNEAVAAAARERGILANVVDDGARSSFIFPAVVDRSPVVVAVGTSGASPTLARRVRAQIESLLPARLGQLAVFAGRWRHRVRAALPSLSQRLRFWEGFLDGSLATRLLEGNAPGADALLQQQLDAASAGGQAVRGEVYLIGAGPGDPDLLTLRAQRLLQQADVVLHDRLVPEAILQRARRDAERVDVGKAAGGVGMTQPAINQLLVEQARRGLRVARLKGGDPFVFGRGGEEVEALREAGIPVRVVPGITAGVGAAANAVLPLTHRGVSQSVTFVTATAANACLLDWAALARPSQTVVFYMAGAQLARITAELLARGLPASHPVALVERATWQDERILRTTVGQMAVVARQAGLRSPTLLVVGEVAALEDRAAALSQQLAAGG